MIALLLERSHLALLLRLDLLPRSTVGRAIGFLTMTLPHPRRRRLRARSAALRKLVEPIYVKRGILPQVAVAMRDADVATQNVAG